MIVTTFQTCKISLYYKTTALFWCLTIFYHLTGTRNNKLTPINNNNHYINILWLFKHQGYNNFLIFSSDLYKPHTLLSFVVHFSSLNYKFIIYFSTPQEVYQCYFRCDKLKKDLSIEVSSLQSDHSPLYVCRTCTVFAACLRRVFPILGQASLPYLSLILTMCLQHKQPVTPSTFTISRRAEHPAQVRWLWYQLPRLPFIGGSSFEMLLLHVVSPIAVTVYSVCRHLESHNTLEKF